MLHPSYTDLMRIVNSESEDDTPVVNSRYSIVMATAKRARQIVAGEAAVTEQERAKPLSTAVKELSERKIHIIPEASEEEQDEVLSFLSGTEEYQDEDAPAETPDGDTQE